MHILAECYGDTTLSKVVLLPVPAFNLQNADIDRSCNIGAVSSTFSKYYNNRKAIGIIDRAKNIGATFKNFKVYEKNNLENMVHLWNGQKHHLIYFKNGLEHFIDESATQAGIDRSHFPKFKTTALLVKNIKTIATEDDGDFKNFLATIRNAKPANFQTFINWVDTIRKLS